MNVKVEQEGTPKENMYTPSVLGWFLFDPNFFYYFFKEALILFLFMRK
jgi:hypothetical protein